MGNSLYCELRCCSGGRSDGSHPRNLVVGDVNDEYVLGDALGAGAMGVVRRATCRLDSSDVAVKTVLLSDPYGCRILSDAEERQLLTEVDITSMCDHPNVICTRKAFVGSTTLDIVMDLATGGEVTATFMCTENHSESKAQDILRQLCSALAYLHGLGIAHRDVKPENVLYVDDRQTQIKLVDFGFASRGNGHENETSGITAKRRTLVGTPPYMAPEMFKAVTGANGLRIGDQCVSYDASVDMWAVGVFAYLVLFGLLPFAPDGRFFNDFKESINDAWSFPEHLRNDYSSDALAFIDECLVREPSKRLTASASLRHMWMQKEVSIKRLPHFEAWRRNSRKSQLEMDAAKVWKLRSMTQQESVVEDAITHDDSDSTS